MIEGIHPGVFRDPIYQQMVQKIARLSPEEKAIFDITTANQTIAGMSMRNFIASRVREMTKKGMAEQKGRFDTAIKTSRERSERKFGLAERGFALKKKGQALGEARTAKDIELREARQDILGEQLGFRRGQQRIGRAIGAGNVILSGVSAISKNIRDMRRAELVEDIIREGKPHRNVAELLKLYTGGG